MPLFLYTCAYREWVGDVLRPWFPLNFLLVIPVLVTLCLDYFIQPGKMFSTEVDSVIKVIVMIGLSAKFLSYIFTLTPMFVSTGHGATV